MPVLEVKSAISDRTITANDLLDLLEKINNIEPVNNREERFLQFIARTCMQAIATTKYLHAKDNN